MNDLMNTWKTAILLLSTSMVFLCLQVFNLSGQFLLNISPPMFHNHGKEMLLHANPNYSSHFCVDGRDMEVWGPKDPLTRHLRTDKRLTDAALTTCIFRNLVYVGDRTKFQYVVDPDGHYPFEQFNDGSRSIFPWRQGPVVGWSKSRILLSYPRVGSTVSKIAKKSLDDDTVHVLTEALEYANYGHQMVEGSWLAFEAMLRTQMMDPNNVMLSIHPGNAKFQPYHLVSTKPVLFIEKLEKGTRIPWLVVGTQKHNFNSAQNHLNPFLLKTMADFGKVVWRRRFPSRSYDKKKLIVVRKKKERHGFSNHEALLDFLFKKYPRYEVKELDPPQTPFREEIDLIMQAALYITPGGGGAYSLVFLPQGSSAIVGAFCWPHLPGENLKSNPKGSAIACRQTDRHLWAKLIHVHQFYYSFKGPVQDFVIGPRTAFVPELDFSYPVDLDEMGALIQKALAKSMGRM